jgi:hypothetical protein
LLQKSDGHGLNGSGLLETGATTLTELPFWSRQLSTTGISPEPYRNGAGGIGKMFGRKAKGLDGILESCGRAATAKDKLYSRMLPV